MVNYTSIEAYGNPIFRDNHDDRLAQYKALIDASKAHGSLFVAQLSHVGRQGGKALNPEPVSASDVQLMVKFGGNEFAKPRPLNKKEIEGVVEDFAESAFWCWKAGADGAQIHCAHGYLLAQFISPSTNKRTDEYGGSLENRSRIVFEIIDKIREKVPDKTFSVSVKLNSVEFQDGGITTEDFQDLCIKLEKYEVDFVDLSGGTFEARAFKHAKESTVCDAEQPFSLIMLTSCRKREKHTLSNSPR
jgi:2,4-dienoyl-CoA reductase-like NADH-dependent reductase (Old Yellow Enzyme family)